LAADNIGRRLLPVDGVRGGRPMQCTGRSSADPSICAVVSSERELSEEAALGICSPGYWRWRNPAIAAHPRVPHTLLAHHVQTMPILSAQRLVADYRFLLTSPTAVPIGFEVVRLSKLSFHRCLVFRNVGRSKATEPAPESLTRPRRGVSASLVWESWGSCRPPGSRLRW
jgi:hypothetical protein